MNPPITTRFENFGKDPPVGIALLGQRTRPRWTFDADGAALHPGRLEGGDGIPGLIRPGEGRHHKGTAHDRSDRRKGEASGSPWRGWLGSRPPICSWLAGGTWWAVSCRISASILGSSCTSMAARGCYRSGRPRSRPTASARPTGCGTESMPLSTAHCGRQRHHQPENRTLDGSSASRFLHRQESRESLGPTPSGGGACARHRPRAGADVRRTTRGERDHDARILAFWASNSASVRTPWDLRSASLAS